MESAAPPFEAPSLRRVRLSLAFLALVVFMAYCNSFSGPFILDDGANITENRTIRSLWPPWSPFFGPVGHAAAGRPFINFTLAVNYAMSGEAVWSYHAMNLAVHILAALVLFGIVRRTLLTEALRGRWGRASTAVALVSALLWGVHPLSTQAVTYVIQRCESFMGFFFLLTLYCAIRGWGGSRWWHAGAALSMILGVGSKEVIVAAPVTVLCYDWIFVHGRGRGRRILADSPLLYGGLALGLVLLWVLVSKGALAATVSADVNRLRWSYLVTEAGVIVHYLKLSVWPHPLSMDYGWPFEPLSQTWPQGLFLCLLFAATAFGVARRLPAAFLGAWFFLTLAPSSSLKPQLDPAFEYRMYLALAAITTALAAAAAGAGGALEKRRPGVSFPLRLAGVFTAAALVLTLTVLTLRRNDDYRSPEKLWADTIRVSPGTFRAHFALANEMAAKGRSAEAYALYIEAARRSPDDPKPANNLGLMLLKLGRTDEAIGWFRKSIAVSPRYDRAYVNLGEALMRKGLRDEARAVLAQSISLSPDSAQARLDMGLSLMHEGRAAEGEALCREALALEPDLAEGRYNFALALLAQNRTAEASEELLKAVSSKPDFYEALVNAGAVLMGLNRVPEATALLARAVAQKPDSLEANFNLGNALASQNLWAEALPHYEKARDLAPSNAGIRGNLGITLINLGRRDEALKELSEAARLDPQDGRIRQLIVQLRGAPR